MKRIKSIIYIFVILTLLWPASAFAKEPFDDKVIFGGTYTLESGETLDGNLVIFGGAATLEPDSTANGDVVLIGGTLEINGIVNGSLVGIGGVVNLNEAAVVNGDLVTFGATLDREDGARVHGEVINGVDAPFVFDMPQDVDITGPQHPQVTVQSTNPFLEIIFFFFRTFMLAALAVLIMMFFSSHTEKISRAAITQPIITGGAGLLTAVLAPMALIALIITIILIPVAFIAVILLVVAWILGLVALGYEVGRRFAEMINQEWAPAISAGVGTFVLAFILGMFGFIHCIGWIPQFIFGIWGIGAVLMTRFGTQEYMPLDATSIPADKPVVVVSSEPEVIVGMEDEPVDLEIEENSIPEDGLSPESKE